MDGSVRRGRPRHVARAAGPRLAARRPPAETLRSPRDRGSGTCRHLGKPCPRKRRTRSGAGLPRHRAGRRSSKNSRGRSGDRRAAPSLGRLGRNPRQSRGSAGGEGDRAASPRTDPAVVASGEGPGGQLADGGIHGIAHRNAIRPAHCKPPGQTTSSTPTAGIEWQIRPQTASTVGPWGAPVRFDRGMPFARLSALARPALAAADGSSCPRVHRGPS